MEQLTSVDCTNLKFCQLNRPWLLNGSFVFWVKCFTPNWLPSLVTNFSSTDILCGSWKLEYSCPKHKRFLVECVQTFNKLVAELFVHQTWTVYLDPQAGCLKDEFRVDCELEIQSFGNWLYRIFSLINKPHVESWMFSLPAFASSC